MAAALRSALPGVPIRYLADSAFAPYGERTAEFIRERTLAAVDHLRTHGAGLIVLACNTATAHAAEAVRVAHPGFPVVGIEPGIKPAVAASRSGRIGVLATRATVNSDRFRELIKRHAPTAEVTAIACTGVVSLIESGDLHSAALQSLVKQYCAPLREARVDTVLLGCTHYPLIAPLWRSQFDPEVQLLQIEQAVAQQAKRLWVGEGVGEGAITLSSTADPTVLGQIARDALGWRRFGLLQVVVPETGIEPVRPA